MGDGLLCKPNDLSSDPQNSRRSWTQKDKHLQSKHTLAGDRKGQLAGICSSVQQKENLSHQTEEERACTCSLITTGTLAYIRVCS